MSSNFQNRLYEMEVVPPSTVWNNLAVLLDEINADKIIADKLEHSESIPPPAVWEKIQSSISETPVIAIQKKSPVIFLRRLAAAAIVIGIIATAWFVFLNNSKTGEQVAKVEFKKVTEKTNVPEETKTLPAIANADNKNQLPAPNIAALKNSKASIQQDKNALRSVYKTKGIEPSIFAVSKTSNSFKNEKPGHKTFDQPIDDLSMVALGENYMTMVNANGRMVKIPAHLVHLAPQLQNKPVTEDYYEILFGEGTYWKEQLNTWRQQLATSPVSSGDIFSNMMELLKSVQEN